MLEARTAVKKLHTIGLLWPAGPDCASNFNERRWGWFAARAGPLPLARFRTPGALSRARNRLKRGRPFSRTRTGAGTAHDGVDEAIHLLCSTYLDPGDEALIVVPTFAMYAVFAQLKARASSKCLPVTTSHFRKGTCSSNSADVPA